MSDTLSGWVYVGRVIVNNENRIKLHEGLFEYGILNPDNQIVYWGYDKGTGIPIISNKELEGEAYEDIDDGDFLDPGSNNPEKTEFNATVPQQFFEPDEDTPAHLRAQKVPERAYISNEERRHFVFNADLDMHNGDTRSVYLLTDDQITDRLEGPGDWGDSFSSKPQFF